MGTKRLTEPYRSVAQGLGIAALIGSLFPGLCVWRTSYMQE